MILPMCLPWVHHDSPRSLSKQLTTALITIDSVTARDVMKRSVARSLSLDDEGAQTDGKKGIFSGAEFFKMAL